METTNAAGNIAEPKLSEASMLSPETLSRLFDCTVAVKATDGRWFIQSGHAGFNSPANNADGYSSRERALAAIRRYGRGGTFARTHEADGTCRYPSAQPEGICGESKLATRDRVLLGLPLESEIAGS
jgi:hypothetical protein